MKKIILVFVCLFFANLRTHVQEQSALFEGSYTEDFSILIVNKGDGITQDFLARQERSD